MLENNINNKEPTVKNPVPISVLAVYCVCFYTAWTIYHFFILKHIDLLPTEIVSAVVNDAIGKNLVWTLPALWLIIKYSDRLAVSIREMFKFKKEDAPYLLLIPAFAAYILFGIFIHGGKPAMTITISQIVTVIFVGLTEELVFRGWLLGATAVRGENAAIAVNSVMFLVIHFPRWINEGVFVTNIAQFGFVSIIALSVIFSLVYLKTKNIILPIILHMFWDLAIFYLY